MTPRPMNFAYVDPPYSLHFHALGQRLAAATGGQAVALLSSPAYRLYTGTDRTLVLQRDPTERADHVPATFERMPWSKPLAAQAPLFAQTVQWLKARMEEEGVGFCLVFSDVRPFSAAVQVAARELGVPCVFVERGAFRLRTSSLSTQGLNARFRLTQARLGEPIEGLATLQGLTRRPSEPWLRTRFLGFMLRNLLAFSVQPWRAALQHKTYRLNHYVRIALRQIANARHDRAVDAEAGPRLPPGPRVLLPLQLETDTQFVLHSPFNRNQELLDFVVEKARAVVPGAVVLVKRHPMDVRGYKLPAGARWVEGNLQRYFASAVAVVCVNSNVGFEAAVAGKRVLCFGDSFYTEDALVARVGTADFAERLGDAVERGDDVEAGRALLSDVLRLYQAPGDVWAYNDGDLEATARIVLQHVAAARAQHAVAP